MQIPMFPKTSKHFEALEKQQNSTKKLVRFFLPFHPCLCPVTIYLQNLRGLVNNKRISPYYYFEESCRRNPDTECIWSRVGCYSWRGVYDMVNTYGQWFIDQG